MEEQEGEMQGYRQKVIMEMMEKSPLFVLVQIGIQMNFPRLIFLSESVLFLTTVETLQREKKGKNGEKKLATHCSYDRVHRGCR